MNQILNINGAIRISRKHHDQNKTIVLVGGCFDIVHVGHIKFLENAKKHGDLLFLLLENDKSVQKLKGKNRPINNQQERATVLASIKYVDYVVKLEDMKSNQDYDNLIYKINPNIIAVTKQDKQIIHKKRQAKIIGAKIIEVISKIKYKSTTNLAKLIEKDF